VTEPAVRAIGVEKVFHIGDREIVALRDSSFEIMTNEFVSFVGPSGCGKSTLLRMLAGLIRPTGGTIAVNGSRVDGPNEDVAICFQSPVLLPWKTIEENVMLPALIRKERPDRAGEGTREFLRLVGLTDFAEAYPWQVSGGMQQRAALARLLMTGARTLLLDEPFGALDEFNRERMNLELLRLCREVSVTTVFVTHNIQEAVFLSDRVVVMTPHPGTVAGIVEVPFSRPREISLLRASEFHNLVFEVREVLGIGTAAAEVSP
jgi:NitT/TauT family transport system ATP-binding protein